MTSVFTSTNSRGSISCLPSSGSPVESEVLSASTFILSKSMLCWKILIFYHCVKNWLNTSVVQTLFQASESWWVKILCDCAYFNKILLWINQIHAAVQFQFIPYTHLHNASNMYCVHVKQIPCHYGMVRPQLEDGGDSLQICSVAVNIWISSCRQPTVLLPGGWADNSP